MAIGKIANLMDRAVIRQKKWSIMDSGKRVNPMDEGYAPGMMVKCMMGSIFVARSKVEEPTDLRMEASIQGNGRMDFSMEQVFKKTKNALK